MAKPPTKSSRARRSGWRSGARSAAPTQPDPNGSDSVSNSNGGSSTRRRRRSSRRRAEEGESAPREDQQNRRSGSNRPGQRPQGGSRKSRSKRGGKGQGRGRRSSGAGKSPRQQNLRQLFDRLQQEVSIDPCERWKLSRADGSLTPRVLDLVAPIGRGQRCLIVAPPKAGKTTLLLEIAESLHANHPEAKVFALLVDERPEEVTHFTRSCHAEVIAASSDRTAREHVRTTESTIDRVLAPVLAGEDVVLLLDSITRLARAYNTTLGDSGRTLTGGLDANTMQMPRRIFGAARNLEGGGSLTIIGTALIDTGSKMDEVIFQEFKGTGNTEIVLSRQLFEKRIFPAVDIAKSGTRKEEKLYDPEIMEMIHKVRRVLANMSPDRAMEGLLKLMAKHPTNEDLLRALPRT